MERIDLKFSARKITKIAAKFMGGTPPVGIEISVQQADTEEILSQMFEWFGEKELIKFIKS